MTTTDTVRGQTPSPGTTLPPLPGTAVSRFFSDGYVATWRNIKKIVRVPDILVFTLIQPIMFVLRRRTSRTASSTASAPCL